jgi:hypothetical protein
MNKAAIYAIMNGSAINFNEQRISKIKITKKT